MQWQLDGLIVTGKYMNQIPVKGKVELSRVAYGGGIKHTVLLDESIEVYGAIRERVILDHFQIETVKD